MIIFHQKIVLFTYTHSPFHDHHRSMYFNLKVAGILSLETIKI